MICRSPELAHLGRAFHIRRCYRIEQGPCKHLWHIQAEMQLNWRRIDSVSNSFHFCGGSPSHHPFVAGIFQDSERPTISPVAPVSPHCAGPGRHQSAQPQRLGRQLRAQKHCRYDEGNLRIDGGFHSWRYPRNGWEWKPFKETWDLSRTSAFGSTDSTDWPGDLMRSDATRK